MARYRKVDSRIWNDEKFRALSDQAKLQFLFLLTHPHMTALGAMRGSLEGLAAEIGWPAEAFREAFREASGMAMAKHDSTACFLWLPNFLKYNRPESPNVVRAWEHAADLLPECQLKNQCIQAAKAFVEGLDQAFRESFLKAFLEGSRKAMPYPDPDPDPEQEQEPDKNHTHRARAKPLTESERHRAFERIKAAYPKFGGRQDWVTAEHAASHLVDNGLTTWGDLLAGAQRYAAYVAGGGVSEPRYVLTPGKFFRDPDRPYSQLWELPSPGAGVNGGAGRRVTAAEYDAQSRQRLAEASGEDPGEL